MAITKVKPAAKAAEKVVTKVSTVVVTDLTVQVDKLIEATVAAKPLAALTKVIDAAKKSILAEVSEQYSDNEEVVLKGTKGVVSLSLPACTRNIIDLKEFHHLVGDDKFYACIKVSLTDLDKVFSPSELESLPISVTTGNRRFASVTAV